MTEAELIAALRTLVADQREAVANNNWSATAPFKAYDAAMHAVIERYRKTNPYASTAAAEQIVRDKEATA